MSSACLACIFPRSGSCKFREYRGYLGMISGNRTHLSSYLTGLLSSGRAVFSRDEAVRDLGSSPGAFLDAAERLQRRGHLVNVRHGFYNAGAPCRAVEDRFYYRKDMAPVSAGIEDRKTDTGRMKVSSVELTVLDLLHYPRAAGALTISPRSCRMSAARSTSRMSAARSTSLDQVADVRRRVAAHNVAVSLLFTPSILSQSYTRFARKSGSWAKNGNTGAAHRSNSL